MIRFARTADRAAISEVVEAAFGRPDEAGLVDRLREDGDVLFELVSDDAGEVTGHVLFSRLWVDRTEMFAALAPLAVRPGLQRAGVGSSLVRTGLKHIPEFGAHGVLVLGDPAYYGRFGFSADTAARVTAPFSGHPAFQAIEIEAGAFAEPVSVAYPDAFSA